MMYFGTDLMHAQYMAETGGLRMMYDMSMPGVYDPRIHDPWYGYHDNRPQYFNQPISSNFPQVVPERWDPICTRDVYQPPEFKPFGLSRDREERCEFENRPGFVRWLDPKPFPDYSEF